VAKKFDEKFWRKYAEKGMIEPNCLTYMRKEIQRKNKLIAKIQNEITKIDDILSLNNKNNSDMLDKNNKL